MITLLRSLCLLAVRVFYRTIALSGIERLPADGPCLVVANHPNGLLDPVVTRLALKRPLAFLAKSTLFGNPLGRTTMKAFDAIPVYRASDKADTSQNERTFQLCRDRLGERGWVMLFPEGTSHSDPALRPLKTGTARIALSAEAAHGFKLGLRVVPVGLLYEDKEIFRTRAAAAVGQPFTLENYAEQYQRDERGAVEALTKAIDEALGDIVLEADSRELWNGFLAVAAWTSPDGGQDFPAIEARARALARAYQRLSAVDPERAARVVDRTRRFSQVLKAVGVEHPFALESAQAPRLGSIAAFLLPLVTLWPFALLGTVLSFIPYQAVAFLVGRMKSLEADLTSTVKAIAGLVFFTLMYLVEGIIAGVLRGWPVGLATFVLAPCCGYVALRYWERVTLRREALRSWWLRLNRQSLVEAVRQRRQELVEVVEAELAAEGGAQRVAGV